MDDNETEKLAPRNLEKFVGSGVLGVSGLIFFLVIYSLALSIQHENYGIHKLTIQLFLALIGYSLGVLSIRLIKGSGKKGSTYLLSNFSLLIWGTIFGVAGIIEIVLVIFQEKIEYLYPAVGSLVMGLGSYKLVKMRKLKI